MMNLYHGGREQRQWRAIRKHLPSDAADAAEKVAEVRAKIKTIRQERETKRRDVD